MTVATHLTPSYRSSSHATAREICGTNSHSIARSQVNNCRLASTTSCSRTSPLRAPRKGPFHCHSPPYPFTILHCADHASPSAARCTRDDDTEQSRPTSGSTAASPDVSDQHDVIRTRSHVSHSVKALCKCLGSRGGVPRRQNCPRISASLVR